MEETKSELSEREIEILKWVATGLSNKEIAAKLFISPNTVKVHLRNVFAKTNVVSRTEATLYAIREGLVEVGETGSMGPHPSKTLASIIEPALFSEPNQRKLDLRMVALLGISAVTFVVLLTWFFGPRLSALNPQPTLNATQFPQWEARAEMPTARSGLAVALYEGQIYAIAGQTTEGPTNVVEKYDPNTNLWQTLKTKPTAVSDVQSVVIGGQLYVPGGIQNNGQPTNKLEIYDPTQNIWKIGKEMPIALSAYALVAFEGKVLLFGGWDGKNYRDLVYEYNPDDDKWQAMTPMPQVRGFLGAVTVGGKVYILGGTDGKKLVTTNYTYSPQADKTTDIAKIWTEGSAMPEGVSGFGMATIIDSIYLLGGESPSQDSTSFAWRYDIRTTEWSPFEQRASLHTHGLGVVADGTRIFLLGGKRGGEILSQNYRYQVVYVVPLPQISP